MENETLPIFKGKLYGVASTNLQKIGWSWDNEVNCGIMRVVFRKGSIYDYYPVSRSLFSGFFESESKGEYFQKHFVKNKALKYNRVN